ncbi:MAG: sigma-70 family RNA polymerase sigma factor [Candidatus Lambdaproteobacteria bacterium]|nr:sigma-70 family RNA polymerase sigma factor [Candidatus Lambdaproteobacteria bacterium]
MEDLGRLLEEQIPRLRRYAHVLARDSTRAEDLVQECLERAWQRMHLWTPGTDMRAWLFTIMHNLHANAARRYHTGPAFTSYEHSGAVTPVRPTQHDALELEAVQAALDRLPEEQRQVVILVAMEQMSYREVADILNIPAGTVMSRLHRGREALRGLLGGTRARKERRQ